MYHTVPHKKQALTSNIYHTKLVAALDPWEGFGGVQEARTLTVGKRPCVALLSPQPRDCPWKLTGHGTGIHFH